MQYSWNEIEGLCLDISRQITLSDWKPDYIIGVESSGLVPALLISNFLSILLETINTHETNYWMSEDALNGKNILVVDALTNDTTFDYIKQDWMGCNSPNAEEWSNVFGNNVRFATLVHDATSDAEVGFHVVEINSIDKNINVSFPWENFWRR